MPLSVIFPGIWPGIWPVTSDPWPILQESVLLIGHQLPLYFWTAIFACHQREWSFQWLIGISNVNSTIFFYWSEFPTSISRFFYWLEFSIINFTIFFSYFSRLGKSTSSSSQKVQSYSSSYSSSSTNGGRPVTEYSTDSMHKSSAKGPTGIPHTSYSHTTSGYSSENPYKNRHSTFSYNI